MKTAALWAERRAARKRVLNDEESAEWINTLVYRFWQYYEPGKTTTTTPTTTTTTTTTTTAAAAAAAL